MTIMIDPHIQLLRDALVEDHEAHIIEIQKRADEAGARGDEWYRRWHQDHIDRLRTIKFPWEEGASAGR